MEKFKSFILWFSGIVGAIIVFASQISLQEATSNIISWIPYSEEAPDWLIAKSIDDIGLLIGLALVLISLCLLLAGKLRRINMSAPVILMVISSILFVIGASWYFIQQPSEITNKAAQEPPTLEIRFDNKNTKYVQINLTGERYFVGLLNNSTKTIRDITLRDHQTAFTDKTIVKARELPKLTEQYRKFGHFMIIDPKGEELILVLNLDYSVVKTANNDDVFGNIQRFTLEARAEDTEAVFAEFEYNREETPMIKRIK